MRIGSGTGEVLSELPISFEPKLPLEVNAGDQVDLPVAVVNATQTALPVVLTVDLPSANQSHAIIAPTTPTPIDVEGANTQRLQLPAGGRTRIYFPLKVVGRSGTVPIEVRGQAGKYSDATRRSITVVPAGYPVAASYGGSLSGAAALTVRIPGRRELVPGSLHVSLTAYPSAIGEIEDGFQSILREPTGCFEQASAENYPNVLTLEYYQQRGHADPELTRRCKVLLQSGYERLTSYECKSGGFEWFGRDPGHETLTAHLRRASTDWEIPRTFKAWLRRSMGAGSRQIVDPPSLQTGNPACWHPSRLRNTATLNTRGDARIQRIFASPTQNPVQPGLGTLIGANRH